MDKKQQAIVNMAKFIKTQSLDLLERLDTLGLDERAEECERLHEIADKLHQGLVQEWQIERLSSL